MVARARASPHQIGTLGERSLHAALKTYYLQPGDRVEEKVDGYWVDIRRGHELIEIQTGSFSAIKRKLETLLPSHAVRVVHPVAVEKWITRTAKNGRTLISRRKSPKRGSLYDVFDELVSFPHLLLDPNFTLEVVLVREEERRCDDGKGSWRRGGTSIRDRRLLDVAERTVFRTAADFRRLLPPGWTGPSTNRELAGMLKVPYFRVARMTYCLTRMGVITAAGKRGNALLFVA
jgi:chloramphenicol 3-O-phosphotransferase